MLDCWGEDYFDVDGCCKGREGGCEMGIEVVRRWIEECVKERISGGADKEEGLGGSIVEFWIWARIQGWRCI